MLVYNSIKQIKNNLVKNLRKPTQRCKAIIIQLKIIFLKIWGNQFDVLRIWHGRDLKRQVYLNVY